MTVALPVRKKSKYRTAKLDVDKTPFQAPYETRPSLRYGVRAVPSTHGGYGSLAQGHITGPFCYYENAAMLANREHGVAVRWVDWVQQSTAMPRFRTLLETTTAPLRLPVTSFCNPVSVRL